MKTLACILCASSLLYGQASKSLKYSILMAGNPAGSESATIQPGGAIDVEYTFNDRGRGPAIHGRYQFDPRGFPASVELTGHDYLKAPVDEHLAVKDGEARWKSTSEQGEARAQGYYVAVNAPTSNLAWMVGALLRARDHQIPLLPAGQARLETGAEVTLESQGRRLKVSQYLITGLDFTPVSVWLDPEKQFFAEPSPWTTTIREGWESSAEKLIELERAGADRRYLGLSRTLSRRPRYIVIQHVRVFDSVTATVKEDQAVWITGGRIELVEGSGLSAPPDTAEFIDGSGKTLLPGLWDMHAHIDASEGILNIASGVTSVRDMANDTEALLHLRKQYDSGEAIGPRIFMCGFMDGRGPYQGPGKVLVDTAAEARAAIERYSALGYQQIKVYSSLKPELFPGIVQLAHAKGMRVSGHVPNGMTAERFVREGADEIQHMNFIFLNFMADQAADTRTPARFTVVADNAAGFDQESPRVSAFIQLLKDRKIVVDPTLGVFEGMFTDRPGKASASWTPVLSRLPSQVQRTAFAGGLPAPAEKDARYKASFQALMRMTRRLYEAGVPLVAGMTGWKV